MATIDQSDTDDTTDSRNLQLGLYERWRGACQKVDLAFLDHIVVAVG